MQLTHYVGKVGDTWAIYTKYLIDGSPAPGGKCWREMRFPTRAKAMLRAAKLDKKDYRRRSIRRRAA